MSTSSEVAAPTEAAAVKPADKNSKVWAAMALVSGVGAAKITNKVLASGWKASTGRKPPGNPADPDVELWEAVAWSIVAGATVSLVRMFAQRRAADYYVRSVGRLPKQLEKDEPDRPKKK